MVGTLKIGLETDFINIFFLMQTTRVRQFTNAPYLSLTTMSKQNLVNLSIQIAGKAYPVLAAPEEVPLLQTVEKRLEQELDDLQRRYGSRLSKQDLLALLLLTYAKQSTELQQDPQSASLSDKVQNLLALLDNALNNK